MNLGHFDIIVVGAGHAGCEAAAAAANMGSTVMLITMNMETIAKMSCNPAMGGVAKGQIVREIDALGGYSGIITDKTMIQFRMLNRSKGPAMWSPRAQSDRMRFAEAWRMQLEQLPNLSFFQDTVDSLIIEHGRVSGVVTQMGATIYAKAVVLTNGTFLNGLIHIGTKNFGGGRMGESAAKGITGQLIELGFMAGRMKTGTPPRVDGRTLDYTKMEEQAGDTEPGKFSFSRETSPLQHQRSCYITYTNEDVHEVLRTGFDESPMYNGSIQGVGPRYCPSIEDKINRFAERERHQIFVEPEGWNTVEIYVNGFSTSLPDHIQLKALQLIPGFERARIFRPGYAIEYDYFPPTQLYNTLETKLIRNLYFAGQINGTTGYEEAACQGLMAGINAHLRINERDPFVLGRDQAYIGVLIDDLVNKGTDEPYRMFTSRAEYRILLRQDNADIRLTPLSHALGLADDIRMDAVEKKITDSQRILDLLQHTTLLPEECNPLMESRNSAPIREKHTASRLLARPQIDIHALRDLPRIEQLLAPFLDDATLEAEIQHKYSGYLEKEKEQAAKLLHLEHLTIPSQYDYMSVHALSMEARLKLQTIQPSTIGQASRISGVTPSDVSILLVRFGR
jgi:tRNA uridine 5-carboxymethylaminomethyl modification enzyme